MPRFKTGLLHDRASRRAKLRDSLLRLVGSALLSLVTGAACTPKASNGSQGSTDSGAIADSSASGSEGGTDSGVAPPGGPSNLEAITGPAKVLVAAETGTCAIVGDRRVGCWGWNLYGELGIGSEKVDPELTPVALSALSDVVSVSVGANHKCALLANGSVKCWGWNIWGQIGDGTNTNALSPVTVTGLTGATDVKVGGLHSCALLSDGTVRCWGRNSDGQLGDGTKTDSTTPVPVSGLADVVEIGLGWTHSCALRSDHAVLCWGADVSGQLGKGYSVDPIGPGLASTPDTVRSITVGGDTTCALLADQTAECWGDGAFGQVGRLAGGSTNRLPVAIADVVGIKSLAAGTGDHICAVLDDHSAWCWGYNGNGQLGPGTNAPSSSTPIRQSGLSGDVEAIVPAGQQTCALLVTGGVECWGLNNVGQLGNGSTTSSTNPVFVTGFP